jgi:hypothetical protein
MSTRNGERLVVRLVKNRLARSEKGATPNGPGTERELENR